MPDGAEGGRWNHRMSPDGAKGTKSCQTAKLPLREILGTLLASAASRYLDVYLPEQMARASSHISRHGRSLRAYRDGLR